MVDALKVRAPAFLSPIAALGMPALLGDIPKSAHADSLASGLSRREVPNVLSSVEGPTLRWSRNRRFHPRVTCLAGYRMLSGTEYPIY